MLSCGLSEPQLTADGFVANVTVNPTPEIRSLSLNELLRDNHNGLQKYEIAMTTDQEDYQRYYRVLMLILGLAMLGWAIPYGVAHYKFDRCSEDLQIRLDAVKSEIAKTQLEMDGAKKATDQR